MTKGTRGDGLMSPRNKVPRLKNHSLLIGKVQEADALHPGPEVSRYLYRIPETPLLGLP